MEKILRWENEFGSFGNVLDVVWYSFEWGGRGWGE